MKDATRGIVIIGYSVFEKEKDKIWDYLGCAYPMGVVSSENNLLFDQNQIDKVIFEGYLDSEGKKIMDSLREKIKDMKQ